MPALPDRFDFSTIVSLSAKDRPRTQLAPEPLQLAG